MKDVQGEQLAFKDLKAWCNLVKGPLKGSVSRGLALELNPRHVLQLPCGVVGNDKWYRLVQNYMQSAQISRSYGHSKGLKLKGDPGAFFTCGSCGISGISTRVVYSHGSQ